MSFVTWLLITVWGLAAAVLQKWPRLESSVAREQGVFLHILIARWTSFLCFRISAITTKLHQTWSWFFSNPYCHVRAQNGFWLYYWWWGNLLRLYGNGILIYGYICEITIVRWGNLKAHQFNSMQIKRSPPVPSLVISTISLGNSQILDGLETYLITPKAILSMCPKNVTRYDEYWWTGSKSITDRCIVVISQSKHNPTAVIHDKIRHVGFNGQTSSLKLYPIANGP